jgi:hypothetical protein
MPFQVSNKDHKYGNKDIPTGTNDGYMELPVFGS